MMYIDISTPEVVVIAIEIFLLGVAIGLAYFAWRTNRRDK
jgi:hypothetical protein